MVRPPTAEVAQPLEPSAPFHEAGLSPPLSPNVTARGLNSECVVCMEDQVRVAFDQHYCPVKMSKVKKGFKLKLLFVRMSQLTVQCSLEELVSPGWFYVLLCVVSITWATSSQTHSILKLRKITTFSVLQGYFQNKSSHQKFSAHQELEYFRIYMLFDNSYMFFCPNICTFFLMFQSVILFLNCGHVCCCNKCAEPLQECPLCRSPILQRIRLAIQL